MTTRTLAQLVLRIWSVMLLVNTVIAVPAFVSYLAQDASPVVDASLLYSARLSTFASLAVQLLMALVIFGTAPALARWIATDDADVSINADGRTLLTVGLAIFGATLIVGGLTELGPTLYAWIMAPGDVSSNASYMAERRATSISRGTIELLIGVALFAGRDAMAGVWRKLRSQDA